MRRTMADPAPPASDPAGAVPPPGAAERPPAPPPPASSAANASVLEVVARISGEVPKLLLRDSPSEDGGSPILDTSSPDYRTIRQLSQRSTARGDYELLGEIARGG